MPTPKKTKPLVDSFEGDPSTGLRMGDLSKMLFMSEVNDSMSPRAAPESDPVYDERRAQRDALYNKIASSETGPSNSTKATYGIMKALSGLGYLGGLEAGNAAMGRAREIERTALEDSRKDNQADVRRDMSLLTLADADLRNYERRHPPAKKTSKLDLAKTAAGFQKDEDLAAHWRRIDENKARKTTADINKPGKPDYTPQFLANVWGKEIPGALKGDTKVRSAVGQMAVTKSQVLRAEAVLDAVTPSGMTMDQWQKTKKSQPDVLTTMPTEQRVKLLDNITPSQLGELAIAYARTVSGGSPDQHEIDLILQKTLGQAGARAANYTRSVGKSDRGAATGDGWLANELWQGIQREHATAEKFLWDAAKTSLQGWEGPIKATPDYERKLHDMISTQFGEDRAAEFVGGKPKVRPGLTPEESAELDKLEAEGH